MKSAEEQYRKNAAVIVTDGNGHILLCERADLPGVIQTVQGGVDPGESIEHAARRELEEELGLEKDEYTITETLLRSYKYKWIEIPKVQFEDVDYIGQDQTFFLAQISANTTFNLSKHAQEFSRVWWGTPDELLALASDAKRPGIEAAIKAFKRKSIAQ